MIEHLLDNAVEYNEHGGQISIALDGKAETEICLTIVNSGRRMDAAQRQAAVQPFVKFEGEAVQRRGGMGVGLPLVRAIAEAHGGRIEIDETDDHLTRVRVYLPASRKDDGVGAVRGAAGGAAL